MESGSTATLGKLEKVHVRDAWPDEARNFTPWLAGEGIELLSFEIGVKLRVLRCEHPVGRYSLDILAVAMGPDSENDGSNLVVIENQFGFTDHDHLGKLMTYASGAGSQGKGAKTIVWIAEEFREEHRRALEWLNEVTPSEMRFYGVQLELYRIGNSLSAPSLNVLVRPNELVRARREVSVETGQTERSLFYIEYWTAFKEYCVSRNAQFELQSPRPNYYISAATGRSGAVISFLALRRDKWIGCEVDITDSPSSTFAALESQRTIIDAEIAELEWEHKPGGKFGRVQRRQLSPPGDRSLWPTQHEWLFQQGNSFFATFAARLKNLK